VKQQELVAYGFMKPSNIPFMVYVKDYVPTFNHWQTK